MFLRLGDMRACDGREIKFRMVSLFLGFWSRKALERDFQVFGDRESFLEHYLDAPAEAAKISSLDFDRSYLIAIHQGLCPTGGYSVRVKAVRAQPPVITVTVDFQGPGPGDIVTTAMTTPHLFLLVPRSRGKQQPVFRFRSGEGALLAERRPMYGKIAPDAGS